MEATIDTRLRRIVAMRMALRFPLSVALLGLVVIAPAGTIHFWQGWLFLAVIAGCATCLLIWLTIRDPELLERRLRMREKEREQKRLIVPGWIFALAAFAFPAVDHRFGWSSVPLAIVIAANALLVVAYALFARVLQENRWASRVIEVEPGQTVVSSGPYAVVRHPMYAIATLLYFCVPMALGSWWGLLLMLPLLVVLVLRIRNEESVLRRDLAGYGDYAARVRYRLIPRVW